MSAPPECLDIANAEPLTPLERSLRRFENVWAGFFSEDYYVYLVARKRVGNAVPCIRWPDPLDASYSNRMWKRTVHAWRKALREIRLAETNRWLLAAADDDRRPTRGEAEDF